MNRSHLCLLLASFASLNQVSAHSWKAGDSPVFDESLRAHILAEWQEREGRASSQKETGGVSSETAPKGAAVRIPIRVASTASTLNLAAEAVAAVSNAPLTARAFLPFTKLDLRVVGDDLFVGSNGIPDHKMMVGITAWQQQVPLPQSYFGDNAWRIPLKPMPAKVPAMIKGRFLRGAIALAVNGIPIFNPQNNRGEVSYEIGELDQWGGHCGRADDYHYHIVPLHLQNQAGKGMPVAYALDGYPIYGLTEPDGSPIGPLDECHGHEDSQVGYHYHASMKYPYVIGGFHGEVAEVEGQVDPQPRAQGVREALQALRGAEITDFESLGANSYKLSYSVKGGTRSIAYSIHADGTYPFVFDNGRDGVTKETYTARQGAGGRGREGPAGPEGMKGKGKGNGGSGKRMNPADESPPSSPPQAAVQATLDSNGDGIVTAQEFADAARRRGDAMDRARDQFQKMDRDQSGQLETGEWPADAPPSPALALNSGEDEPPSGGSDKRRGGRQEAFVPSPDQPRSSNGTFMLTSSVVEDGQEMPAEFTGDGEGATLPLEWKGVPSGTQEYALIMDHTDPMGGKKWYWTLYELPTDLRSLPKNAQGVGKVGSAFKGQIGYEPPMSKGPGAKSYILTLYALNSPLHLQQSPREVNREVLLAAIKGKVLASSSLRVVHTSKGGDETSGGQRGRPQPAMNDQPPPRDDASPAPAPRGGGKGKGGPDQSGLIKPSLDDTMKLNVYADNWFMLYVNGRLVAVDPIQFTPHNVVSVDFLPEYPMTLAVLAKDNADPKTGMEYGSNIGDGGFILKFSDGTVTNATWKAKKFFHGPLNGDTRNPQVKQEPLPAHWWAVDFDDSSWEHAQEYSVEEVDPKQPYFENDFEGAKFIWTDDLALDNTILFRTKIEKPEWKQRWNTKPDLDVTGAPDR